jgi:GTP pyrophosphokinase
MMRQYELVERVLSYDPKADEALLNRAYVYAMKAHGNQKRASGESYFSHPLEVAAILTDLKLDDATIVTALLHDVIEDTPITRAEIDQLFGPEIGKLVDGLTKIRRLDLVSKKAEQAENFRKLLVAISSDIRVLLVKLADRVHNMRTLEHMKPETRKRISEETVDIYAPLAARMGMEKMREELEDHAFRWLHPEAYATVTAKLTELRKSNEGLVEEIRAALAGKLAEVGIDAEVSGREKKAYAIWRKMANKQISLEQLSDIYAFRVIAKSIDDCYRVLGVAHTTWRTVPGRFKDYISTPKQNNYQSIHTTVVGPRHQWVELQIRTREMDQVAEYGVAAHALYKDGVQLGENGHAHNGAGGAHKENPYIWLRRLVDTLLEGDNPEEFLEHTKLELFQDQVFCFTPKGRLIALPRGATPIDFAYAVHTDVGNSCVGAVINGRQLPLTTQLKNGDQVEILVAKGQTPPAAWERIAVTGKARSAIRRAARDALRRQYSELGRRLLVSAFLRIGQEYSDEKLKKGLSRLTQKTVEDVHAGVGRGELPVKDVIRAVVPDAELVEPVAPRKPNRRERSQGEEGWFNLAKVIGLKFRWPGSGGAEAKQTHVLPIRGLMNDVPVKFEEGGAVPGDRIVGVLSDGEGIRVFQIHSPKLRDFEHEKWIDVTWDIDSDNPERFPAKIVVTALNEPGTLAQIAQVIGEVDGNIDNVRMVRRAKDFTEIHIELEVWDLDHLTQIIAGLKGKAVVSSVERMFG